MSAGSEQKSDSDIGALGALARAVGGVVSFSTRRVRAILFATILLTAASGIYAVQTFDIRTDMDSLISSELSWRKEVDRVTTIFPGEDEDITVVIDGKTPELAEDAAVRLMDALAPNKDAFVSVDRLNGGPFFDQYGLLFLPQKDVEETISGLIQIQPLMGPLAADPSIRGLMSGLKTAATVEDIDPVQAERLRKAMDGMSKVIAERQAGEDTYFSWRSLLSDEPQAPREWRQFIKINPTFDFTTTTPGEKATLALHAAIDSLQLNEASGVNVRVTGSIPISDEELETLAESVGPIAILMFGLMIAILYAAVRSTRVVIAIMLTVLAGGIITSAVGLGLLGRFNLISIAFMPLFIGLGMDFGIQYCVRARADREGAASLAAAQRAAAFGIGGGLALAAASTAAGFLAFLPTSYRGVAELGLIAGIGMVIAFVMTITTLPALICAMQVEKPAPDKGLRVLKDADTFIERQRKPILIGATVLTILFAILLPRLQFDFDPMRLRSPKTESMSTYYDLSKSVDTTPNVVSVLSNSLEESKTLADKLLKVPEVGHVLGVHSFLPPDGQEEKLALIYDARMLLEFSLQPFDVAAAPEDAEIQSALVSAAAALRENYQARVGPLAKSGLLLAQRLETLSKAPLEMRQKTSNALMQGFPVVLAQVNSLLTAEPLTIETLPEDIRRAWLSPDGISRIAVSPSKPLQTVSDTAQFVDAVRTVAPKAAGAAVTIVESGKTILGAFAIAGILSTIVITLLLWVSFARASWTGLTLLPVLISAVLTFGSCAALGFVINLENLIALPLILGIGVAFNIYFVVAWRNGARGLLQSSLARGVLFSALTTGASFGALGLSAHPGTASMGILLSLSLVWIVLTTLIVLPALLSLCAGARAPSET